MGIAANFGVPGDRCHHLVIQRVAGLDERVIFPKNAIVRLVGDLARTVLQQQEVVAFVLGRVLRIPIVRVV